MANNVPPSSLEINGDIVKALGLSATEIVIMRTLEQKMNEKRETIAKLREELERLNNEERANNETLDNYNQVAHEQNMKLVWMHGQVLNMYSEFQKNEESKSQKENQPTENGSQ